MDRTLEAECQGKVTFQIIPLGLGTYAARERNFALLSSTRIRGLSSLVFVEGLTSKHYLEPLREMNCYREALEYLRDAALNPRDSMKVMAEIQEI